MPRTKTGRVEENGLRTRLVEERWHFLVLALLTERAITAGRSRTARQSGHLTEHHDGGSPALPGVRNGKGSENGGAPGLATDGEPGLGTNGEPEVRPARVLNLLTNRLRTSGAGTSGAGTNGASAEAAAHNGAGVNELAGASPARVDAWELGSVGESWQRLRDWLREYFASDHRRALQTALGLLWLLDGALQFQSFMYSHGFIAMLNDTASGQPGWVASSMNWGARIASHNLGFFNTLFALTQVAIGLGLLYRGTVKRALVASFGWAFVVWWFGEGFGLLLTDTASPLTGAPGAVFLYGIIGLLAWPNDRPGGLLSTRAVKTTWLVLWVVMAWAWLLGPNSSANATSDAIGSTPSGFGIVNSLQNAFSDAAKGNGLIIAFVLSAASAAIGLCVALDVHPRRFLKVAIGLSLAYWVLGQGLGGLFTGTASDPNTGLVFVLLAAAVWPLTASSTAYRRVGLPKVATSAYRRFSLPELEADATPARLGLGAAAVALALVILIVAISPGGSSSPEPASLTSLGHLRSPGPQGPIGPEGIAVPNAPTLGRAVSANSRNDADGVPGCVSLSQVVVHTKIHLTVFVQGAARQIPYGIGVPNGHAQSGPRGTFVNYGNNCFSALHTDAADGLIHIMAPTYHTYTLGNFFDVWGQPLGQDRVGPASGRVTALVNGKPYPGNPRDIRLSKGTATIQLEVGTPLVAPVSGNIGTDF